jgi:hypothetical protein
METLYPGKINSPATTLSSGISESSIAIPVTELSVFPAAPNTATIGEDALAETILYTGMSGATGAGNLTGITRGFQGTARSWDTGTRIARTFTAYDYDSLIGNIKDVTVLEDQTAGATLSIYDVVYLKTDGKWYKTDANSLTTTNGLIGVSLGNVSIDETVDVQVSGNITNPSWSLTTGKPIFISDTTGAISNTPGANPRQIGYSVSSSCINLTGKYNESTIQVGIIIYNDNINHLVVYVPISFSAMYFSVYPIVSYDWDFGDSTTHSTELSPVHMYTAVGIYDGILTLTDSQGNTKQAHYTLNVHDTPTYCIQGSYNSDSEIIQFTSHSITLTSTNFASVPNEDNELIAFASNSIVLTSDNFVSCPVSDTELISIITHGITVTNS